MTLLDVLGTKQGECWLVIAWATLFLSVTFNLLSRAFTLAYLRKVHDSGSDGDDSVNDKYTWKSCILHIHHLSIAFLIFGLFWLLIFGIASL